MTTLAVAAYKGGVGKTTTAVYLALGLARRGRTLLVDTDRQGSAMRWVELAGEEWPLGTCAPVHWTDPQELPRHVAAARRRYEHVVIDVPPHGHDALTYALRAAGNLIVPTSPSAIDVAELAPTFEVAAHVDSERRVLASVLLTKVRLGTRAADDIRGVLEDEYGYPLLQAVIPLRESIAQAFGTVPDTSTGPYRDALDEILATHTESDAV